MGNDRKEFVGKRLISLRGESTQDEIAAKVNEELGYSAFTKQKLSKIENGKQEANYDDLTALAKIYAVSTDYLLGLSESRLPESVDTVEYTGLTVEAANYLHRMHLVDETRKDKSTPSSCEVLSKFLCNSSLAVKDMYLLSLITRDMAAFKPRLNLLTKENDAKMQLKAYTMACKYYGPCEIVSGRGYLLYRTDQIANKMRGAIAKTINLSSAVNACNEMEKENAQREDEIIQRIWPAEK